MQQVALDLDPSKLASILKELNTILDDPATGGGACKGHTLVLALHLLKRLKSFRKFTDLLTVQFNAVCRGITCLEQFCPKVVYVCVCVCQCHSILFKIHACGGGCLFSIITSIHVIHAS